MPILPAKQGNSNMAGERTPVHLWQGVPGPGGLNFTPVLGWGFVAPRPKEEDMEEVEPVLKS